MSDAADTRSGALSDPGAALGSYLDALLREPDGGGEAAPLQAPAVGELDGRSGQDAAPETAAPAQREPAAAPSQDEGLALILLSVKGITLALPRQDVAAVLARDEAADACTRTVVLRDVVFPPGHPLREQEDDSRCLVALGEGGAGLLCDEVCGEAQVAPDAVKSAGSGRSRPWLAGMIAEPRCWLIDLPALLAAAGDEAAAG